MIFTDKILCGIMLLFVEYFELWSLTMSFFPREHSDKKSHTRKNIF
jgi:hypothetical protein